jgi:hypothetical protein
MADGKEWVLKTPCSEAARRERPESFLGSYHQLSAINSDEETTL